MRAAGIAILLSLTATAATAQSLPTPPADATPLGTVHMPGEGRGGPGADGRATSSWVWSVPEYCLTYTGGSGGPVTRLVAASGMWIETIDLKLADMMNAICASGRNYALYMTWSGNSAYWTQLLLPAR